jgi:hypothetical protein
MGAPGPAIFGDTEVKKLLYFLNIRRRNSQGIPSVPYDTFSNP